MKHNKLRKTDYLVYKNIPCSNMSEKEIIDTSNLFSEHYGVWSSYCPDSSKCNERVKFPPSMIKKNFVNKQTDLSQWFILNQILLGMLFI